MWHLAVFLSPLSEKEGTGWKYNLSNNRYNILVYCIIPSGVGGKLILFVLFCLSFSIKSVWDEDYFAVWIIGWLGATGKTGLALISLKWIESAAEMKY